MKNNFFPGIIYSFSLENSISHKLYIAIIKFFQNGDKVSQNGSKLGFKDVLLIVFYDTHILK